MKNILRKYKYELLLLALLQHLFIGIFLRDMPFYTEVVWPVNMVVLGFAIAGIYVEKERWKNRVKNVLVLLVFALPIGLPYMHYNLTYFQVLNVTYVVFYIFIFYEIVRFLIRPSYINRDIIVGAACGYLLLIEIATFLFQVYYYQDPTCFKGMHGSQAAIVYCDLVYFSSITLTSIGFGDITPATHYTQLLTSVFGIAGQFYTVVLVGILISKFAASNNQKNS